MAEATRRSVQSTWSVELYERVRALIRDQSLSAFVMFTVEHHMNRVDAFDRLREELGRYPTWMEVEEAVGRHIGMSSVEDGFAAEADHKRILGEEALSRQVPVVAGGLVEPEVVVEPVGDSHESILEFGQCPGCRGFETGQVSARGWRCSGCGETFTP